MKHAMKKEVINKHCYGYGKGHAHIYATHEGQQLHNKKIETQNCCTL